MAPDKPTFPDSAGSTAWREDWGLGAAAAQPLNEARQGKGRTQYTWYLCEVEFCDGNQMQCGGLHLPSQDTMLVLASYTSLQSPASLQSGTLHVALLLHRAFGSDKARQSPTGWIPVNVSGGIALSTLPDPDKQASIRPEIPTTLGSICWGRTRYYSTV